MYQFFLVMQHANFQLTLCKHDLVKTKQIARHE